MPRHAETRILPYSPSDMYDLVADVARYPEFLPWCAAARIRSRRDGGDHEVIEADLVISFKLFREKFGSRVTLWPAEKRIDTEYLDGPFKYLKSQWTFTPEGETACKVDFWVDFEFRNAILGAAAGLFFNEAMQRIVRAFESRAASLFGAKSA